MASVNKKIFFELVRSGLWKKVVQVSSFDTVDWEEVYQLASEQSVLGLVLAGLEYSNVKPPQELLLQWIGEVQQIEQRNLSMNTFIAELVKNIKDKNISTLLVKGQGIAQCYEKPLWRACGDVDLLLDEENYCKAKEYFDDITDNFKDGSKKNQIRKHKDYQIGEWIVELHGTLHTGLSTRIDNVVDDAQKESCNNGNVRIWENGKTEVFLPSPDNDIVFVFTHILQHFFENGIGLRQLCDMARLLWIYRYNIDHELLERRLRAMGLSTEWKAFGCVLVNSLGLPEKGMPLYDGRYENKANQIVDYVVACGNFGHNKDYSFFIKYPAMIRKMITLWRHTKDSIRLARIFPLDSFVFLIHFFKNGVKAAIVGD